MKKEKAVSLAGKKIFYHILKNLILFSIPAVFTTVLYLVFGENCLIKLITPWECPWCGMTRAHLAALRLDFAAAFSYHPLFFLGLPFLFIAFNQELFKEKYRKLGEWLLVGMTMLFFAEYILSLFL